MSRRALLVVVMGMVLAFVLGIGSTGIALAQAPSKPITITWWINPWRIAPPGFPPDKAPGSEDFPQWASEEFMRLHPGVTVKYEVVTNQGFDQKIAAAILAGNPPDLLRPIGFQREWVKQGLLEPVDDYLTPEDFEDFYDYALAEGYVDGHYYLFPWNNSNNGMGSTLLLNPAVFAERGVKIPDLPDRSWTLDEFMEAAHQLTFDRDGDGKTDVYALSFPAKDLQVMMGWMHLFGARMFNEDETEVVLNSPEGVRALQWIVDAIYEHKIAPEGAAGMGIYDSINMFHQGRTAMGYGGPYEIGRIDRYAKEGQIAEAFPVHIAQYPHVPEVGPFAYHTCGGFVVFNQRDPEKKAMVMEFARFLTNQENMALLKSLLYVTTRKSVNEDLYKGSTWEAEVDVYTRALEYGIPYFGSANIDTDPVDQYLQAMFEAALSRTKTPKQALDEFAATANRILFNK
ncbi:MAG: extracellular solute-binding protein [Firmicutes bacterium]|jgi:multiple sugar transport system substrate-binding protein|nr:extracellular solute-binding protein [Bacillota bacterium]